ncbi:MAG TPA: DUF58 domain-containing protein [Actinomycetota bacterium]|nr:DUF58 domain-containing protein [Actinomycetota bacterium]
MELTAHGSPKLVGYTGLAGAFLIGALSLRRPELVALAAPFALAVVLGLALSTEPGLSHLSLSVEPTRAFEGDNLVVAVEVECTRGVDRIDVVVPLPPGLRAADGILVRSTDLVGGRRRRLAFEVRCERWGVYAIDDALVRVHGRFDLLRFDSHARDPHRVQVFPRTETLRALVRPVRTQLHAGNQVGRVRGDGIEFAELRPFVPGDRVRSIDWKVTARRGEPWVRDRHPERNRDVVVFLDAFSDVSTGGGASTLERAVRASAALAGAYLARRDRVGVVGFGGILRWLEPVMGIRQLYRIIDVLLGTTVSASYAWKDLDVVPVRTLPPGALVLGVSPLLDERSVAALVDLRGRGFDVAVVEVSPVPAVPPADPVGALGLRIWLMEREMLRRRLRRVGIAVAEWRETQFLQAAMWEVESFRRSARLVPA